MSLYGALFAGVSGLNAQGSSIAAMGDNISNINTVGYKEAAADFSTLVTNSASTTTYSSGGVSTHTRRSIDQQGLIQNTGVVTDLAISGDGFFVVNSASDGTGEVMYTRAGSFRKDNRGNFVNGAGFTLMAWPLDNEGRLPGAAGSLDTTSNALLDSLKPVNIKSVSGVAAGTSKVDVGLNLKASEKVLKGSGDTISIPTTSIENTSNTSTTLIVPNDTPSALNLSENNSLTFTPSSPGTAYTFTYGGFVESNDITATNMYNAATPSNVFSVLPTVGGAAAGSKFSITTATAGTVTFTLTPSSPNVTLGQFNSLNTLADAINQVSGLTARVANNKLYVAPLDATEAISFADVVGNFTTTLGGNIAGGTTALANRFSTLKGLADLVNGSSGTAATINNPLGTSTIDIYATNPLGTLSITASKISTLNTDPMTTGAAGSALVTVKHAGHGLATGDYVNLTGTTTFDGVTVAAGNYVVTAIDADHYQITASAGTATLGGVAGGGNAIVETEGLALDPFTTTIGSTDVTVSHTSHGLSTDDLVTFDGSATFNGVTLDGSYKVTVIDADTYTITAANAATATGVGGGAAVTVDTGVKVLHELGMQITGLPPVSKVLGPAYDPSDGAVIPNMASGKVTAQFSRSVRMFDAIGTGHDFKISFAKLSANTWSAEVYAANPGDIVSNRTDGQIAYGTVIFNGDGSLRSVSSSLTNPIDIVWANKAAPSEISFNWGTAGQIAGTDGATSIGKTDGLRQYDADYDVQFVDQNGVASGLLTSVNIDADGFVIASFSNGETRKLYKVPLAAFANPNGLEALAGNVYRASQGSGNYNLKEPGKGGIGKITPASLEQANVELADELTKMLVAQRGYQASSKVIKTADDLLEELNRVFS